MPTLNLVNFQEANGKHYFTYGNAKPEDAARAVTNFFHSQGYRLEKGDVYHGTYGIGNQVMRLLFGAIVKRYTFDFAIQPSGDASVLEFTKGMKGWTGGVIGVAKMNSEFARISTQLRTI